ncbi:MAG: tetratricopeptide repeat protein [Nitrospirota bacterium]
MPDSVAETEYRIAIDLKPGNIEARNELGHLFYRNNRLDEAIEQFEAVLKIDNDNVTAQKGMGLILMKQKQYEAAEKRFRKALESGEDPLVMKELHELEQLLEKKR